MSMGVICVSISGVFANDSVVCSEQVVQAIEDCPIAIHNLNCYVFFVFFYKSLRIHSV